MLKAVVCLLQSYRKGLSHRTLLQLFFPCSALLFAGLFLLLLLFLLAASEAQPLLLVTSSSSSSSLNPQDSENHLKTPLSPLRATAQSLD